MILSQHRGTMAVTSGHGSQCLLTQLLGIPAVLVEAFCVCGVLCDVEITTPALSPHVRPQTHSKTPVPNLPMGLLPGLWPTGPAARVYMSVSSCVPCSYKVGVDHRTHLRNLWCRKSLSHPWDALTRFSDLTDTNHFQNNIIKGWKTSWNI